MSSNSNTVFLLTECDQNGKKDGTMYLCKEKETIDLCVDIYKIVWQGICD